MPDEIQGEVDLWGDPWSPPKDTRGRKRHKRQPQLAEKIAVLKASGLTTEEVSSRIGLSEPTIRKYYFRELNEGADLAQAVLNEKMWERAMAGNVAAARYIREEFGKGAAKAAEQRIHERPAAEPKAAPMGKKAERQAAAEKVGGRFATPPAPQLVVDNARRG